MNLRKFFKHSWKADLSIFNFASPETSKNFCLAEDRILFLGTKITEYINRYSHSTRGWVIEYCLTNLPTSQKEFNFVLYSLGAMFGGQDQLEFDRKTGINKPVRIVINHDHDGALDTQFSPEELEVLRELANRRTLKEKGGMN